MCHAAPLLRATMANDRYLKPGQLTVEVPRHQTLARPFHARHPIIGKATPGIVF